MPVCPPCPGPVQDLQGKTGIEKINMTIKGLTLVHVVLRVFFLHLGRQSVPTFTSEAFHLTNVHEVCSVEARFNDSHLDAEHDELRPVEIINKILLKRTI
jgi:hypothetical protein